MSITQDTKKRAIGGSVIAIVAAFSLAFGVSTPSFAATGSQTGEWDLVATSNAQSPKLQSYNHGSETWDTVASSTASFAVGSGKVIDESETATTPVSGGGIRFQNTATTSKKVTFTFSIPSNVGLTITSATSGTILSVPSAPGSRTATYINTVAANDVFHEHFTWTFSGGGTSSAANIGVSAAVTAGVTGGSTAGNYTANQTYRFTF